MGTITLGFGIKCNQGKSKDEEGEYWPVDEDTTFDFSIIPTPPPSSPSTGDAAGGGGGAPSAPTNPLPPGGASFRIKVPAKLRPKKGSTAKNTAEAIAEYLADQLNEKLKETGITVKPKPGGTIPAGNSHAGDPIVLLEFEGVDGLDCAWDYSKIHGWMWSSGAGEPPKPGPFFPPPGGRKWPPWAPGEPGTDGGRPGRTPKPPHRPRKGKPPWFRTVYCLPFEPWKRFMVGVYLESASGEGDDQDKGWYVQDFFFPISWSAEEIARVVAPHLSSLDWLRPLFGEHLRVSGLLWSVDAEDGVQAGSLHYELRIRPWEIRPILPDSEEAKSLAVESPGTPAPGDKATIPQLTVPRSASPSTALAPSPEVARPVAPRGAKAHESMNDVIAQEPRPLV